MPNGKVLQQKRREQERLINSPTIFVHTSNLVFVRYLADRDPSVAIRRWLETKVVMMVTLTHWKLKRGAEKGTLPFGKLLRSGRFEQEEIRVA